MAIDNSTLEAVRFLLDQQLLVRAPARRVEMDSDVGTFSIGDHVSFSMPGQAFVVVGRLRRYVKYPTQVLGFWISVNVAPTGQPLIAALRISGVLTAAVATIPISGFVSPEVRPATVTMAPDDYLTVDITQVGSTLPGGDAVATVRLATVI